MLKPSSADDNSEPYTTVSRKKKRPRLNNSVDNSNEPANENSVKLNHNVGLPKTNKEIVGKKIDDTCKLKLIKF